MTTNKQHWVPLFRKYIANLRIQSKHAASDPDGKGMELKLWTSQKRVMEAIVDGLEHDIHTFYILKSRQLGVTTITLAIVLFWLALHPNTIGCVVSDTDKNTAKNRGTLESYLASLQAFMGKGFKTLKRNKFSLTFSNGSRLDLLTAGRSKVAWAEGEGYMLGHLTEVANYGKEEGISSFRHTMAPDNPRALYIFESTAHGPNHWKDIWEAAVADEFTSKCIFVGWWSHDLQRIKITDRRFEAFGLHPPNPQENELICRVRDEYGFEIDASQLAWYRWQLTQPNASGDEMDQNQPWFAAQAFIQSGVSFFQARLVAKVREQITSAEPASVEEGGYGYKAYSLYLGEEYHMSKVEEITEDIPTDMIKLRVWEQPHPDGYYVIGVDPAGGRSETSNNHAVEVYRCYADKLVQVAEWADSIPETRHCAWVTAYLAGKYANCRINIDMTGGIGSAVMQAFEDLRLMMRSELYQGRVKALAIGGDDNDFLNAANWYMYRRIDSPGPGYMYNSKIGRDLKFRMMNMMRDSWVMNLLELRSVPLLDEMSTVRQDNSDIGAAAQGHNRDDRTFATALANITWIENLRAGLIAHGLSWDGGKGATTAPISPIASTLNRRIFSIMRSSDDDADLPPARTFFEQRGLM